MGECLRPDLWGNVSVWQGQQTLVVPTSLAVVAAGIPEVPKRSGQAQTGHRIPSRDKLVERHAGVCLLVLKLVQHGVLVDASL